MPEGLTPAWLTDSLQASGFLAEDVRITDAQQQTVGDGSGMMSELARLQLTYDKITDLPLTLIAKFPSRNPTNREVAMGYNLYEREVRYFAELDQLTSAYSPATMLSTIDGDNFIILMQDMDDYRIGDQVAGANLDDTRDMIDELAKLHATFWNNISHIDWIPGIADSYHATNMDTLVKIGWPNMCELFSAHIDSKIAAQGEAFCSALPKLQQAMMQTPITLLHGDFRMENVFFGNQPSHQPIAIIDWQGPLLGKGIVDVALMLAQSTRTDVRRAHEKDLIQRYCQSLAQLGVSGYDNDQAWQDYRLAILYNWVYVGVVAGTLDASNERAYAWMSQMVARQSAASLDLAVFDLLP